MNILWQLGPVAVVAEESLAERPPWLWAGFLTRERIVAVADEHGVFRSEATVVWRKVGVSVRTGPTQATGVVLALPRWFPYPRPSPPTFEPHPPSTDPR